ncbi:histidine kinase, partial [Fervidobacterium sp. SC_NGM5_O18]
WFIKRCYNDNCYEISSETIREYLGVLDTPEKIKTLSELLEELESSIKN